MRMKSRFCPSRESRPKRWRLAAGDWAGMSGGLNRRQAFAAHAAAIGKRGFAALARIAVKKSVLPFAADF
jgi:hypothetical protein